VMAIYQPKSSLSISLNAQCGTNTKPQKPNK